jgi:hypothetical protein
MKQILFALFISLVLSNCAPTHSTLPSWESQDFNSTQKKFPAVSSIKKGRFIQDQNRSDINQAHSTYEDENTEHATTLESFYRSQKRYRNLPQSRYGESLRHDKLNKTEKTDQQTNYQISNRFKR